MSTPVPTAALARALQEALAESAHKILMVSGRGDGVPDLFYAQSAGGSCVRLYMNGKPQRMYGDVPLNELFVLHRRAGSRCAYAETQGALKEPAMLSFRGWTYPETRVQRGAWCSNDEGTWYVDTKGCGWRVRGDGMWVARDAVPAYACERVTKAAWAEATAQEIEDMCDEEW